MSGVNYWLGQSWGRNTEWLAALKQHGHEMQRCLDASPFKTDSELFFRSVAERNV